MSALRTRSPIHADTAATVGVVMEIVAAALASAGIDINPTAVARLVEESPANDRHHAQRNPIPERPVPPTPT